MLYVVWPVWSLLYGAARNGDVKIGVTEVTSFLFALPLVTLLRAVGESRSLRLFYLCVFSLAIVVILSFGLFVPLPESG
ncbi:MAG TPA: hypothetical protein VNB49_02840, partial [Candidatus Dormibacteraeota bacterium]|nr:hypothetical protein [Candidatus Dormibacteraeota bacterium]